MIALDPLKVWIDAAKPSGVLTRLNAVLAWSSQNSDATALETDDNNELLNSPKQTPPLLDAPVGGDMVAA